MAGMVKYIVGLVAVLLFMSGSAVAQYGRHSVGIKLGNDISANYNYSISGRNSLNFNVGLVNPYKKDYQYLALSGAFHHSINSRNSNFYPYIGVGVSAGVQYGEDDVDMSTDKNFYFSADVPLGLQYDIEDRPAVVYLEWSPKFRFTNDFRFVPNSIAVGVRFSLRN